VSRRKQQQTAKRRRVGLVAGTPEEAADGPAFSNVGLDDGPPPAAAAAAGGGGSGDEGSSVPPRPTAPSTPVAVLSRDVWFPVHPPAPLSPPLLCAVCAVCAVCVCVCCV
jgi:hypothetical protein